MVSCFKTIFNFVQLKFFTIKPENLAFSRESLGFSCTHVASSWLIQSIYLSKKIKLIRKSFNRVKIN